jgi:rod shape-determining protein MreC
MQDLRQTTRRWVAALVVLGIVLAGLKTCAVLTRRANVVDQTISRATTPPAFTLKRIGEGFISLGHIFEVPTLLRENNRLKQENAFLQQQLDRVQALKQENERLGAMLKIQSPKYAPVAAIVIARPYDLWLESVLINAGRDKGVRLGNLVLNAKGVVGLVSEVEGERCRVQLISSPRFRLGAVSAVSRDEGVIRGVDWRTLVFDYLPAGAHITLGEKVYTLGEETFPGGDNNRPKGEFIGTVTNKKVDKNGFLEITVEPAISTNQLGAVVVMTR